MPVLRTNRREGLKSGGQYPIPFRLPVEKAFQFHFVAFMIGWLVEGDVREQESQRSQRLRFQGFQIRPGGRIDFGSSRCCAC